MIQRIQQYFPVIVRETPRENAGRGLFLSWIKRILEWQAAIFGKKELRRQREVRS